MPNPLLQSFFGSMNTSKRKNAHNYGDPDPEKQGIEPIPEEYEGENNAYRGIEQHGVTPTELAKPFTGFEGEQIGLATLPPIHEIDPVPVEIVNRRGRELRDWKVDRAFLNEQRSHQLFPQNENRTSGMLINNGPNTIYVSPDSGVSPTTGWPVALGATFTFLAETALYATVATGESASLRLAWEHTRQLPEAEGSR